MAHTPPFRGQRRKHQFLLVLSLLAPPVASGQQASTETSKGDVPKAEVFVEYAYLNIDTNNLTSRQSANGWETSVSGNFNKWLGAEFDVSGHYKTYGVTIPGSGPINVRVTDYSYLAGPRINFRPLFVRALFGGNHLTGSAVGFSASQGGFAGVGGGGMQLPLTRLLSFRASADYALSRHNIFGGPSVSQNNFRVSVGIVFTFGGPRRQRTSASPRATHPPIGPSEPSPLPAPKIESTLLGAVGYETENGFHVTSVRDGSPAEQIFIRPGDVIMKIDERVVKSAEGIDSAVAASASGIAKVTGLTQTIIGAVQFERVVKLP